jgi:hypothetical protein
LTLHPNWRNPYIPPPPFPFPLPSKRKVFVSYHHERDQQWFDYFTNQFSENYEVFQDQSLDEEVDSEDLHYVNRVIREDYISGSSITIVLCGALTYKRRFVDWEIASTLHYEHALLGIVVPDTLPDTNGKFTVPARLHDNIESGYATFQRHWPSNADEFKNQIEVALSKSRLKFLIKNDRLKMKRNLP